VPLLTDIRPLKVSVPFRRLWLGQSLANVGAQMTLVAVAFEVYSFSHSTFKVGLVGFVGLMPLVLGGLYGGALVDAFDRRLLAIVSGFGLWSCSIALLVQGLLGLRSELVIYVIVAIQAAMSAVNQPARTAMLPQLMSNDLLPAANALGMAGFNAGFTVGPLLGGLVISLWGAASAYAVDVVLFTVALYASFRLPKMPPVTTSAIPGWRSIVDGIRFLKTAPNVRMTFIVDMCAMVFAQPRSLFPALAVTVYAGSAATLGILQSAPAIGALVIFAFSGWITIVHRHGVAVMLAILGYGLAVLLAGLSAMSAPSVLWVAVVMLAASGAADIISGSFRSTILQTAAPDDMRGRMQGIFFVVVAGGPRLGDFVAGSLAEWVGASWAMILGGLACVLGVLVAVSLRRQFLAYDSRHPTP
jgi:MFS family permease